MNVVTCLFCKAHMLRLREWTRMAVLMSESLTTKGSEQSVAVLWVPTINPFQINTFVVLMFYNDLILCMNHELLLIGFPEQVSLLVESHVTSKRYLTHIEPQYKAQLAADSTRSLIFQGVQACSSRLHVYVSSNFPSPNLC